MPRLMYDAVTASNIPRNAAMVAGYVDQIRLAPWSQADWNLFPSAVKVQIVKKASSNWGHVLDVEPGDATPAEAPGWVKMRRNSGFSTPTIYCNLSTWPSVYNEFKNQGVAQPLYWIAKYDDIKNFPVLNGITAIAKQYHGNDPHGFDISYVADFWPGVDGVDEMPLTQDDLNAVAEAVWTKMIFNNRLGREEWAKTLLGASEDRVIRQVLLPLQQTLLKAITDSDTNDLTKADVTTIVTNVIETQLVPAVVASVDHALEGKELNIDNAALSASIIDKLKELSFKAV